MNKNPYTILTLHDFKAKISEYIHRLDQGREHYILRRYKKNVAMVLSIRLSELNNKADAAQRAIKRHFAALERHKEQRRVIRARLLSCPVFHRLRAAQARERFLSGFSE